MAKEARQQGSRRAGDFHENDLKICDLCGWLNLETNDECFVCGWRGHFERDPEVVHTAVELSVRRHGRLELQYLTDPRTYHESPPLTLQIRFCLWLDRLWNWLRG
jgi:hypothetical protein